MKSYSKQNEEQTWRELSSVALARLVPLATFNYTVTAFSSRLLFSGLQVFTADLAEHPQNGWSLRGRVAALQMQGRTEEALRVEQTELKKAWQYADLELSSSCLKFSSL